MSERHAKLRGFYWPVTLAVWAALAISPCGLAGPAAEDAVNADFFETRVRPIFAEHCYRCHSIKAEKLKGGLRLDDRAAFFKGGESGPEVVPAHPENSRLITAVTYGDPDLQMPPKTRLAAEQIADLSRWVASGAVWPDSSVAAASGHDPGGAGGPAAFDVQARRAAHWAWQPVRRVEPPAVAHADWPRGAIDRFILARLEQHGLAPAGDCDRRTLIRRASFAITGFAPTPEDVEAFVADSSPGAFEKVVDRLLASPRFGEHWARHWLDLVRYSDTLGNEADAPIPNAWQYRDYVIRAFNADTPYDQFVAEHIAGDLLEHPRMSPDGRINESVIGTGFFWMNEGKRSPVDVRQAEADCFDNKIDVLCKTFLGLTVACARCHDHKFDPIAQRDYYALYGYLKSSRYTQALLNRADVDARADELSLIRVRLRRTAAAALEERAAGLARYLIAAGAVAGPTGKPTAGTAGESLSAQRLDQWKNALHAVAGAGHPMFPWVALASLGPGASSEAVAARLRDITVQVKQRAAEAGAARKREGDIELADFGGAARGFGDWFAEDQAFGPAPCRPGDLLIGDSPRRPIQTLFRDGAWAHSGYLSRRLQGTLRSPTVTLDHRYLHVLAAGRQARVNVNIEHFVMIQAPLYESLRWVVNDDGPRWHTFDLGMWKGCRAYIEFADTTTPDLHDNAPAGIGVDGYIAVGRVVLSDRNDPPVRIGVPGGSIVTGIGRIDSPAALAAAYERVAVESLHDLRAGELCARPDADARAQFLSWMIENGLLDPIAGATDDADTEQLAEIFKDLRGAEAALPAPVRAPATIDGTAEDEHVFIRGNHSTPGQLAPRRVPEAIAGASQPPAPSTGSGRLDLARRLLAPSDPFVTRMMVNRIWYHIFDRGIVPTVDNFGAMGEPPTHPELLDYLAARFVQENWSIKKLIREMVLSRTFAMSSAGRGEAETLDPDNRLFHRMPVRRLEAESIRDEILEISARLDSRMYGPGVEVFLTPEMQAYTETYGKPARGGPLDGDGRRSIYLMVRRNFLTPMLVAFDSPPPLNTVGRRTVSNVPAQALTMMNDPFVAEQAGVWARRILAMPQPAGAEGRVRRMYAEAFARPPTGDELADVLKFLDEHGQELGVPPERRASDPQLWADVAHVLMNLKEFIFIN